jgi:hypothetical protein
LAVVVAVTSTDERRVERNAGCVHDLRLAIGIHLREHALVEDAAAEDGPTVAVLPVGKIDAMDLRTGSL